MSNTFIEPPECMGCKDSSSRLDKRGNTYTCELCGLSFSEAVYKEWKSVWYTHYDETLIKTLKHAVPGSIIKVPDGMTVRQFGDILNTVTKWR